MLEVSVLTLSTNLWNKDLLLLSLFIRFVLRVRYLPSDYTEIKFKDRVTFSYYYEQIKNDFMLHEVKKMNDQNLHQQILELGCLEMR